MFQWIMLLVLLAFVAGGTWMLLSLRKRAVKRRESLATPSPEPAPVTEAGATNNEGKHELIFDSRGFYGMPLFLTLLVCLLFCLIGYSVEIFGGFEDAGVVTVGLSVIYLVASFKTVRQEELGLIRLFDEGLYRVDAGPVFVPKWFMSLDVQPRGNIQSLLPGSKTRIFYGDTKTTGGVIPRGYIAPIRILSGPPKTDNGFAADHPYNKQMVVTVHFVVNWRIYDLLAFVTNIGSIEEALRQMRKIAEAVSNEKFSQGTPAVIMQKLTEYSEALNLALDKKVSHDEKTGIGWGVDILSASIEPLEFSHELNQAVVAIPIAEQTALVTVISAEAEAKKIERTGTAEANKRNAMVTVEVRSTREQLRAQADGAEQLRAVTEKPNGLDVLGLQTARAGLEGNPHLSIIAGSDNSIAKGIASIATIARSGGGNSPKESQPNA